jgi:SAM-dependent methyltransferase
MAHDAIGLGNLIDRDMRAFDTRAPGMIRSGELYEGLGLTAPAVAVLREECRSIDRSTAPGDQGITHVESLSRVERQGRLRAIRGAQLRVLQIARASQDRRGLEPNPSHRWTHIQRRSRLEFPDEFGSLVEMIGSSDDVMQDVETLLERHGVRVRAREGKSLASKCLDASERGIHAANQEARDRGLKNATFERLDVARLDAIEIFDLITAFDAIHDQARPDAVLAGIARALRPDGVFLMQEIAGSSHVDQDIEHPIGPFLYTVSCMHCMTVSLSDGGAGLGAMWGSETATRMLGDAGFGDVRFESLPHDVINHYYTAWK